MTELVTTSRTKLNTATGASAGPSATKPAEAPALITEQQVLLSTAAAVALPPAKTRRLSDAIHSVAAAVSAVFASSEKLHAQRHYPKRHVWLENSLMSREMDRL